MRASLRGPCNGLKTEAIQFVRSSSPISARLSSIGCHANIQDAFNEHGVQIMSSNGQADRERRLSAPPRSGGHRR